MAAKLGVFTLAKIAYGENGRLPDSGTCVGGTSPHAWGKPGAGEARPEPYWPMRTC